MSSPTFTKATRKKVFLKLAVTGPSGSGKTYSALRLARGLVGPTGKVALIDTENGSASLYADKFEFDTLDLAPPFDHQKFVEGITAAVQAGYQCIIIDSASHFWEGILEYKSQLDSRPGSNSYTNWRAAGDKFSDIIKAVLQSPVHLICCMRSKMDYVQDVDEKGKKSVKKVGLAPIMRDGIEYEFTTVFDVALDHRVSVSKDRSGLFVDKIFQVTEDTGKLLEQWRNSGAEPKWKQDLEAAVEKASCEAAANAFLKRINWIGEAQTYRDVGEDKATKILSNFEGFLTKINA